MRTKQNLSFQTQLRIAISIICPLMYLFKAVTKHCYQRRNFVFRSKRYQSIFQNLNQNQIQTQQSKLHDLWTQYETLNAKLEKIKKEYSAIGPSQKLRLELDEIKQINKQQEETIDALKVKLRDRERQVLILEGKRVELSR